MSVSGPRIGIIGGTFDPVHNGHLFVAEEARVRLDLERVLIIPHGHAPHKDEAGITSAEARFSMCVLAVEPNAQFDVSRAEVDRPGKSYTLDTLRELREIYGRTAELYFLIGADAILEIMTWYRPDEVLAAARFVAVNRPGSKLSGLAEAIGPQRAAEVARLDVPGLDISSTDIRRRAREGLPIRYLTPDPVVDYITEHSLYAGSAAGIPAG